MSPASTASPDRHLDECRQLSASECRGWVEQHHEGRLGYLSGRGPRSVVVSYTVVGDQIRVRVPDYNDIAQYAPGAQVTLAVDGALEATPPGEPAFEEVSVTGTAAHAKPPHQPPVNTVRFDESWPTGIKISVVSLPLTELRGVQFRLDALPSEKHQSNR